MAGPVGKQLNLVVPSIALNALPDRRHRIPGSFDVLGKHTIGILQMSCDPPIVVGCVGLREQVKQVEMPQIGACMRPVGQAFKVRFQALRPSL